MVELPVTELNETTAAAVARTAEGQTITITDKGQAVAQLTALPATRLQELIASGRARRARRDIANLPAPEPAPESAVAADVAHKTP